MSLMGDAVPSGLTCDDLCLANGLTLSPLGRRARSPADGGNKAGHAERMWRTGYSSLEGADQIQRQLTGEVLFAIAVSVMRG